MVQTILISITSDAEVELGVAQLGPFTNNTLMKCLILAIAALRLKFNATGIQLAFVFPPLIDTGTSPDEVGEKSEAVGEKEGGEVNA